MNPHQPYAFVAATTASAAWIGYVDTGLRWAAAIVAILAGAISIYKSLKKRG